MVPDATAFNNDMPKHPAQMLVELCKSSPTSTLIIKDNKLFHLTLSGGSMIASSKKNKNKIALTRLNKVAIVIFFVPLLLLACVCT